MRMLRVVVWDFKGRGRQFTGRAKSKREVDKCLVARQRQEDPKLPTRPCPLQVIAGDSCTPVGDLRSKFFWQLRGGQRFFLSPLGLDHLQLEIICIIILRWQIFFPHRIHAWTPLRGLSRRSETGLVFLNIEECLGDVPGCPPSSAEGVGSTPAWGAKVPQASWPKSQTMEQKQYCDKFNKDLKKKLVHSKKIF